MRLTKKSLAYGAVAAGLLFGGMGAIVANADGTGSETATITPGTLSVSFTSAGALTATVGAAEATGSLPALAFGDATGSGAGYNITESSTDFTATSGAGFTEPGGPAVISAGGLFFTGATVTPDTGTTSAAPVSENENVALSAATSVLTAALNTGMGQYTATETGTLALTPETYTGAYAATMTTTIVSGP